MSAMNNILAALHNRKSVRAYLDRPISTDDKEAILLAACEAPTAGNQQRYTILDISDPILKDKLDVSCDNQPFIAKASMALFFCADSRKWYDAYIEAGLAPRVPGVGDLILAVTDASIAAQNAVTAAESLGIGSCYIGDILEQYETLVRFCVCWSMSFPVPCWSLAIPLSSKRTVKNQPVVLSGILSTKTPIARWTARNCGRCSALGLDQALTMPT